MSLVTIDDRITRLHEHSVSIEVVERVDRDCFYTSHSSIPLAHEDENILWVRGQHVLDSDEVKAARSAVALGENGYEPKGPTGPTGLTGSVGPPGLLGLPYPQPAPPMPAGPLPGLGYVGDVRGNLGQTITGPLWGRPELEHHQDRAVKPLAIDDPVTVLDETGKLLVQALWNGEGAHVYRYCAGGRVNMPNTAPRFADEGVTWCRGHVTDKDDAGKALLVAGALAPDKHSITVRVRGVPFPIEFDDPANR